jgi:hypothetical protein
VRRWEFKNVIMMGVPLHARKQEVRPKVPTPNRRFELSWSKRGKRALQAEATMSKWLTAKL